MQIKLWVSAETRGNRGLIRRAMIKKRDSSERFRFEQWGWMVCVCARESVCVCVRREAGSWWCQMSLAYSWVYLSACAKTRHYCCTAPTRDLPAVRTHSGKPPFQLMIISHCVWIIICSLFGWVQERLVCMCVWGLWRRGGCGQNMMIVDLDFFRFLSGFVFFFVF